jgi:hypothetical protein
MIPLSLAACSLAFAAHTPHHAVAADDTGWSYYGITGGPYITNAPAVRKKHSVLPDGRTRHARPILVYGPVPTVERIDYSHHSGFPKHGFGLGWFGTRTPSPRPNPQSVSVHPVTPGSR